MSHIEKFCLQPFYKENQKLYILFPLFLSMKVKVIIFSIIGLGFLALTFLVDWLFIIGAVAMMFLNQKELFPKEKK